MDTITKAERPCIYGFCRNVHSMGFGMSGRGTAALAVDVLRRVGYGDARHERSRPEFSRPIISVAADQAGGADEVLRVVQRIDPHATPLHLRCRILCESAPERARRA